MSTVYLFILSEFPLKLMRDSCKTQPGEKPLYNYIQLGLVGTFVILTHHQLSAAAAAWRPWWRMCASQRAHLFIHVRIPLYFIENYLSARPYVCVQYIPAVHLPQLLEMG